LPLHNMVRPRVFMDFAVSNEPYGRVVFELFTDTAPRTCENFRALCTGEKGISANGNPLYYKNSIIHRSIKDFMIQGGDFTKRNGTGGESIYGGTFSDEDLQRPLESPALLCMANKGPHTNGSQFFVTLRECLHLNGKHVVFGRIIKGYEEVVKRLVGVPVDEKDRPTVPIIITNCGELELKRHKDTDNPKSKKYRSRRRSHSDSSGDKDQPQRKRNKFETTDLGVEGASRGSHTRKETEEEYDARLEREETERLESERKRVLDDIKANYSKESRKDGVQYKGRGRMKYVDPENQHRL